MIRVLIMIAAMGFLMSIICLSVAVGIAGPDALANGNWGWNHGLNWTFNDDHDHWGWSHRHWGRHWNDDDDHDGGPTTTRDIAWTGGETLGVDMSADVTYTQGAGPAKVTVTGPQGAVQDVEIDNGHLRFRDDRDHDGRLTIVVAAPSVSRFEMDGSGKLAIANYKQDHLSIDVSGDGDITANGQAGAVDLTISGSGNADLGDVKSKFAKVEISGSGDATLAPSDAAVVNVSGSGDVTLRSHPPKLETNVSGSGSVHQEGGQTGDDR